jgi:hypothetical protein
VARPREAFRGFARRGGNGETQISRFLGVSA